MKPVTFISGATGYIGSRLSTHLASRGENLLLSAKDDKKLKSLSVEIKRSYPEAIIESIECDLADPGSWSKATDVLREFKIKNYVNCSGIQGQLGKCTEISDAELKNVFNVNLFSSIYFTNLFTNSLSADESLSVIHFSGGGATAERPLFMSYSISKTALVRFVENFAAEHPTDNVRINAISPGVLPSRMQTEVINNPVLAETKDYLIARESLSKPENNHHRLLDLCDFLLSENSKYLSGKLISSQWDNWEEWSNHVDELVNSDLYTLRRITGRDHGLAWGDL